MDLFSSFSLLLCQLLIPLLHAANVTEPSGLSNQIAVRIEGGVEKAKEIARRHHCEFIGQVSIYSRRFQNVPHAHIFASKSLNCCHHTYH